MDTILGLKKFSGTYLPSLKGTKQPAKTLPAARLITETVSVVLQQGMQPMGKSLSSHSSSSRPRAVQKKHVIPRLAGPRTDYERAFDLLKNYAHAYRGIAVRLGLDESDIDDINRHQSNEDNLHKVLTLSKESNDGSIDIDSIYDLREVLILRTEQGKSLGADVSIYGYTPPPTVEPQPVSSRKRSPHHDGTPDSKRKCTDLTESEEDDVIITAIEDANKVCDICLRVKEIVKDPITQLNCSHSFCLPCIENHMCIKKRKAQKKWKSISRNSRTKHFYFKPFCPTCKKATAFLPEWKKK